MIVNLAGTWSLMDRQTQKLIKKSGSLRQALKRYEVDTPTYVDIKTKIKIVNKSIKAALKRDRVKVRFFQNVL